MPSDQGLDNNELLNDIHHVNQITKEEIKRSGDYMRQLIDKTPLPAKVADSLVSEISSQLGQLTATVNLADKAIRKLQARQKPDRKAKSIVAEVKSKNRLSYLRFDAHQLVGNKNLLPMEVSTSGINYCWSGADPEIQFSFPLNRSKALGMHIRLIALIKPEYSKKLKILIDDRHIKHSFRRDGSLFVVSCVLPYSEKTTQTDVKVILPATHSPSDLDGSNDGRKLGIAINEIRFGKPESSINRLLVRLKLKK